MPLPNTKRLLGEGGAGHHDRDQYGAEQVLAFLQGTDAAGLGSTRAGVSPSGELVMRPRGSVRADFVKCAIPQRSAKRTAAQRSDDVNVRSSAAGR